MYAHMQVLILAIYFFFFFNDTATTEIYTLSLHDALPICYAWPARCCRPTWRWRPARSDRKSTRLNSSHANISYAVFCLKKKNKIPLSGPHGTPVGSNSIVDGELAVTIFDDIRVHNQFSSV